ncbi:MAG: hypothetical protein U7126_03075 [Microcoleus sp.]
MEQLGAIGCCGRATIALGCDRWDVANFSIDLSKVAYRFNQLK